MYVFIVRFFSRYVCLLSFAVSYHTFIHCDCCNVTFNDKRASQKTLTLSLSLPRFLSPFLFVCLFSQVCVFCVFHSLFPLSLSLFSFCSFYLSHFMQETAIIRFCSIHSLFPSVSLVSFVDLFRKSYDI